MYLDVYTFDKSVSTSTNFTVIICLLKCVCIHSLLGKLT